MADFKIKYGFADQALTITLASLGNSATAGRESTVVSNTSNLFVDAGLYAKVLPQSGTPANDLTTYVYVYGTTGGTKYPDNLTGADAAVTPTSEQNLGNPFTIRHATSATTAAKFFGGIATLFGGSMPEKWGVFLRTFQGFALNATGSNHEVVYQGYHGQSV